MIPVHEIFNCSCCFFVSRSIFTVTNYSSKNNSFNALKISNKEEKSGNQLNLQVKSLNTKNSELISNVMKHF